MTDETWHESDSLLYRKLVDIAVPRREAQIATLLTLLPMAREAECRVVELGCGTGALSWAILDSFPRCEVTALDGSATMLRHTEEHLDGFRERLLTERFELGATGWHRYLEGVDAVVSSLALHHLAADQKRHLFSKVGSMIAGDGALLVADLIAPQRPEAEELFCSGWERSAEKRAARHADPSLYDAFQREQWNFYRYPDDVDKPSPLFDQLLWLSSAGFDVVDCFWLQAGHAVYGGYRSHERKTPPLDYAEAISCARRAVLNTSR